MAKINTRVIIPVEGTAPGTGNAIQVEIEAQTTVDFKNALRAVGVNIGRAGSNEASKPQTEYVEIA